MKSHYNPSGQHNYWNSLSQAFAHLREDDFATAEAEFTGAEQLRETSPGRVFITEKIGDRLQRMLRRKDPEKKQAGAGRWVERTALFRSEFQIRADQVVREGLRLAGLRPEDEASTNQPVLVRALYLVSRSRLFSPEPRSAIPLLKGLFRTAQKTGVPFAHDLVRHDLPLTEEDRLWLAAKGGDMLESFLEQGTLVPGSVGAGEWARAILQLLRREYFGSSSRLETERSWLEAVSADRLLDQPASCVALYRQFLDCAAQPGNRGDLARLRILEILANVDALHFSVPRYQEAVDALGAGLDLPERGLAMRRDHALDCIAFRRPVCGARESLAWVSVGLESDGSLGVVFWQDDQPRDMAFWFPGSDPADLDRLLASCGDRVIAWSPDVVRVVGEQWASPCNQHSATGFATALLEPLLAGSGRDAETFLRLGLSESGPWSRDWTARLGHPFLQPPNPGQSLADWRERPGQQGLLAGLIVLAMRTRLEAADPSLRAGIGELGRHGDEASWFLYDLLTLGKPTILALDGTFAPWTLPLLWTRPGPWPAGESPGEPRWQSDILPDLGRNDLSIVYTGSPYSVLLAWGNQQTKWRVVWDCFSRAQELAPLAATVLGPVTLLPSRGTLHALVSALELLKQELSAHNSGDPDTDGLMCLFHWARLVETHNGDLEDYLEIRGKTVSDNELYDCYNEFISGVERFAVEENEGDPWGEQYVQRLRKSGLVAGAWTQLNLDAAVLDARWGVFDGSDASWVFLDSAAVHRGLLQSGEGYTRNLHGLLCSRGHRHLSLLVGAAWMADLLSSYLESLLQVFGRAYQLTLQDRCPPVLKLVDQGIRPDAERLRAEALSSQFLWLQHTAPERDIAVFMGGKGLNADFWQDVAGHQVPGLDLKIQFLQPGSFHDCDPVPAGCDVLVLPELPGYEHAELTENDRMELGSGWDHRDEVRNENLEHVLARCALELAGLMAGPWREVIVLDTRWWHLLWGRGRAGEFARENWSVATAQQIAGAVNAQLVQLPDTRHPDRDLAAAQLAVHSWLNSHGHEAPPVANREDAGGKNAVVLEFGEDEAAWIPYATRIEMAREQGQLGAWMLMVAPDCQESWRAFTVRDAAQGSSVLRAGKLVFPPAALVWVSHEQIREPRVLPEIFRNPPAVIHILDLDSWLPSTGDGHYQAAMALRQVLQGPSSRVVLHTRAMDPAWTEFFTALLGDRLRVVNLPVGPGAAGAQPGEIFSDHDSGRNQGPGDFLGPAHERLRRVLAGMRPVLTQARGSDPGPSGLVSAHELVAIRTLALLAGLNQKEVILGVQALRWALGVGGEHLPAAMAGEEDQTVGEGNATRLQSHGLLIAQRFAELEHILQKMERDLRVMVPLWLQGLSAGMRTWIDLEYPPAAIAGEDLMRLDALLLSWCGDGPGPGHLIYCCPGGSVNSNARWVGCDADTASLTEELAGHLARFRLQLGELMDAAVETPGGFLVDTGLLVAAARERGFLALGAMLGFWRWLGPVSADTFSLVDVLALADVMAKPDAALAWELCAQILRQSPDATATRARLPRSVPGSFSESRGPISGLRNLLSGESRAEQDYQSHTARVTAAVTGGKPGQLVLLGTAGSGRHQSLVRGIVQACQELSLPPGIKVYCPDMALAAHLSEQFLRWGADLDFALEIPGTGPAFAEQIQPLPMADTNQIVILCEAQRWPVDLRYQISQMGRGRLLLVTADLVASEDSWENLFLTSPRPEQVLAYQQQRHVPRRIWSAVRDLFPGHEHLPAGISVPDRGELVAVYASNLDQCLGRLFADSVFSGDQACLRVVAGVKGDLDYLGSSLADKGWSVVYEKNLETWLNPGPREFLAILADLEAKGVDPLVPFLLPGVAPIWWSSWCVENQDLLQSENLMQVWDFLKTQGFCQRTLAHKAHRGRVVDLMGEWGDTAPLVLLESPLAGTVRLFLRRGLGFGPEVQARPTALLTEAPERPGIMVPDAMYLCLGSEHPLRHYQHWSRVTRGLLVLFQECSPLPGDRGP